MSCFRRLARNGLQGSELMSLVPCADLAGEWDDADDDLFQQRLARAEASITEEESISGSEPDAVFEGGLRIPGRIFTRLFDYQKTGEHWLFCCRRCS